MNTIPFGPRNPPEDPLLAKGRGTSEGDRAGARPVARDRRAPGRGAARVAPALVRLAGRARGGIRGRLGFGAADLGPVARCRTRSSDSGRRDQETQDPPRSFRSTTGPTPASRRRNSSSATSSLVQFREKFGQLKPETREAIVKNLAVMQTRGRPDRCGAREGSGKRNAEGLPGRHLQAGIAVVFVGRHRR